MGYSQVVTRTIQYIGMRCNKISFPQVVFWVSLILGAVVRLAYLNEVPSGYAFDEVGIAYNAWSISTWHRDQFAHFMPLSFESFGDYKPPVMIYLTGLFYLLTGPQLIVVRLISAAAGVLSIAVSFYLAKLILPKSKLAPAFVALTVALSPWSVHLSRIGFEQNLAFLFGLSGITLLFMGRNRSWYWIPAGICLALSMSTFHTAKIFVPMVLLSFFWTYRSLMHRYRKQALIGLLVFLMAITPIAYDSLLGQGNARAETLVSSLTELGDNVMNYISPGFWIMGWDGISIRHAVPGYGVLLWPFYLILIGTILVLVRNKRLKDIYWPLALIVMGLMPGILTTGSPHVIRSQFALIGSALIVGYGLELIKQYKNFCAGILL